MIYTKITKKALAVCFEAHKDQKDKTGMPYVFHPFHLAEQMTDEYTTAAALLHDVVEDSGITLTELEQMGFPPEVLEAVGLLTHDPAVPYEEYIQAIRTNPIARQVKIADLRHNSDRSRWDHADQWAEEHCRKYQKALAYLLSGTNQ